MKLGEFKERIEKARRLVDKERELVCWALSEAFSGCYNLWKKDKCAKKFAEMFYATRASKNRGWLSGYFKHNSMTKFMTERERRLFYLDMFEQYCIVFKVYKEF